MAMARWLQARSFSTFRKQPRVMRAPNPVSDINRVTAPTGILENRGFTIYEFLKTLNLEAHTEKIRTKCFDVRDLLVVESEVLKGLGISVQERKKILMYAHRYRLGIWTPRRFKVPPKEKKKKD